MTPVAERETLGTRVLVLSSFFPPAYLAGGPVRTLEAAIRRSDSPGQYWVMTSNSDLGAPGSLQVRTDGWRSWWGCHVWYQQHGRLRSLGRALLAEAWLRPDVIYLNSLWGLRYAALYLLAHRLRLVRAVVVLAPRGQLSSSALAIKPAKKRVVLGIIKWLGLTRGVVIQASSDREANDARRVLGSQATFVVSSNDILTQAVNPAMVPRPGSVLRTVYIGRVSRIKGVDLLLMALGELEPSARLRLDIYGGAIDETYLRECESLAQRVGPGVNVTFHGPVAHDEVADIFTQADLFVLPTASENFGHVIAEAMANGCPVAVPDTTPWSAVVRNGGGWLLPDYKVRSISALLQKATTLSVQERHRAKRNAASAYRRWYDSASSGGLDRLIAQLVASKRPESAHRRA